MEVRKHEDNLISRSFRLESQPSIREQWDEVIKSTRDEIVEGLNILTCKTIGSLHALGRSA